MGRKTAFELLTPDLHAKALAHLRANPHRSLDELQVALLEDGIDISRSALHRAAIKVKANDKLMATAEDQTVITIVDRVSGEVRVIKTHLPASVVDALIHQAASTP